MSSIRISLVGLALLILVSRAFAQPAPASQPAKVLPVDYQKLKALMPETAAGVQRSNHEGENVSIGEMVFSKGSAEYTKPNSNDKDPHATIEIMDYGASPQMLVGMTAWRSMSMKIENDQGYQRTVKFREFPAFQTYTKDGESRQIMVLVAERFLVTISSYYVAEADFTKVAESLAWDKLALLK